MIYQFKHKEITSCGECKLMEYSEWADFYCALNGSFIEDENKINDDCPLEVVLNEQLIISNVQDVQIEKFIKSINKYKAIPIDPLNHLTVSENEKVVITVKDRDGNIEEIDDMYYFEEECFHNNGDCYLGTKIIGVKVVANENIKD